MDKFSYIANADPAYIESLYEDYKNNRDSVDQEWQKFFDGFDFAVTNYISNGNIATTETGTTPATVNWDASELKVWNLINAYREKGHLISKTNPLRQRKDRHAHLDLSSLGFTNTDLDKEFISGELLGLGKTSLQSIITYLQKIYCRSLGAEFMYLIEPDELSWFIERFEKGAATIKLPIEKQKRILEKLNEAVGFENFLQKKYVGQKRFSLEGGETTIPAIDAIINAAADMGAEEFVIGMAHRGRLNVLATILEKTYEQVFSEFEGSVIPDTTMGDGDVKYHLGFSSQVETATGKKVHLKLSPNPSHLEAVDPVVLGFARAKLDILYENNYDKIVPILIHGDASLAGQGVAYEGLQMAYLPGYTVGGTIHFVINNQIGFTTDFDDARSSNYCTSFAATINAPVLHVNGDDPEAVVFAVELATEFRQKFHKDFFVDMVCYRRQGHNEGDNPEFTQPALYKLIANHPDPRAIYTKQLIDRGEIEAQMAKEMAQHYTKFLQERLDEVKQHPLPYVYQEPEQAWRALRTATPEDFDSSPQTGVDEYIINTVAEGLFNIPEDFHPLKKIQTMIEHRKKIFFEEKQLDWGVGEALAYGTLLQEDHDVRMSGEDVKRGTFSHRHATLYDEETNTEYNRLDNLFEKQGRFRIYNSLLSEFAVLGFEYGYSLATPNSLNIWEAQFGDFTNGAQTIIDEFISSSETKWQRMSGIVLLLPHGYEGQGPDHSSARLERFLQLCAEYNITVANCTTPANFFHLLRRQLYRPFRKPLVVMSPKSLLRHPLCISHVSELTSGAFAEVIDDSSAELIKIKRVLLCSGKIYYDLLEKKEADKRTDIAIVRLEQLYPLPVKQLDAIVKKYSMAQFIWVQEEPANMGALGYLLMNYKGKTFYNVARKASASPSTGYNKVHIKEQTELVAKAFEN